ncbi:hypothetical protein BKA65DRAFT_291977 [Rhexocercosporidium sp. MPI-PUGE-AT-0058]|nr:hypothetical protein BKA65DRAFT_291977 [Rhexocercosporidium sp. MPI-PUGE-AT-0058]
MATNQRDPFLPKNKHEEVAFSRWGIGWRTPAFIIICYLVALVLAALHLVLFKYLDELPAEGPDRKIQQSYVTTASNILATGFQVFLQASLGCSFVQYLWYLLRVRTLRVAAIENLFILRSQIYFLFRMSNLRTAPVLVSLASFIWALYVVTSFPPGALTVEPANFTKVVPMVVPTFNASFMGNGTGADAYAFALDRIVPTIPDFITSRSTHSAAMDEVSILTSNRSLLGSTFPSSLQRLSNSVIVSGAANPILSPCGANCSYTTAFDAPYFQCITVMSNFTVDVKKMVGGQPQAYTGVFTSDDLKDQRRGKETNTFIDTAPELQALGRSNATFVTKLQSPIAISSDKDMVLMSRQEMTCSTAQMKYTVLHTFRNTELSTNITTGAVRALNSFYQIPMENLYGNNTVPGLLLPGFYDKSLVLGTGPVNWTDQSLQWYHDLNLINIIDTVSSSIAGGYKALSWENRTEPNVTIPGFGNILWSVNVDWLDAIVEVTSSGGFGNGLSITGPFNGTLIANSRLNEYFGRVQKNTELSEHGPVIGFKITQDLLNEMLMNVTMSTITAYDFWNTTVNVTVDNLINVYKFSRPLNLIVPYSASLLIALPFIVLGLWALYQNGVPATDGGFIQLITTSTGSRKLRNAAAGGCLGASENAPSALKNLRVRYGEVMGSEGDRKGRVVRRAGFGTEDEIRPLVKGAKYGVMKDERVIGFESLAGSEIWGRAL